MCHPLMCGGKKCRGRHDPNYESTAHTECTWGQPGTADSCTQSLPAITHSWRDAWGHLGCARGAWDAAEPEWVAQQRTVHPQHHAQHDGDSTHGTILTCLNSLPQISDGPVDSAASVDLNFGQATPSLTNCSREDTNCSSVYRASFTYVVNAECSRSRMLPSGLIAKLAMAGHRQKPRIKQDTVGVTDAE